MPVVMDKYWLVYECVCVCVRDGTVGMGKERPSTVYPGPYSRQSFKQAKKPAEACFSFFSSLLSLQLFTILQKPSDLC